MHPLFSQARQLHAEHQLPEAWTAYEAAAPTLHQSPEYWFWLAVLAWQTNHPEMAQQCLNEIERHWRGGWSQDWKPLSPELENAIMTVLESLAMPLPLRYQIERALLAYPALNGQHRASIWYRWLDSAQASAAELQQEITRRPAWWQGKDLLASYYLFRGQPATASRLWQELLAQHPDFAEGYAQIGHCELSLGRYESALEHYQQSLQLQSQQPLLHYHLGRLYLSLLQADKARAAFGQASALMPHNLLWRFQMDWVYLPLPSLQSDRTRLCTQLAQIPTQYHQLISLAQASDSLRTTSFEPCFDINYLTEADAPIRQAFGDMFVLPAPPRWGPAADALRIGLVVTPEQEKLFLFGNQILWSEMAQTGLEITLFCLQRSRPLLQAWADSAGITLQTLSPVLAQAAREIQAFELDLVYFWESGTDAFNYLLPFYQLGRVQFTSWGSVSTTGNPRMQYFLSTESLDPPVNDTHYREKLLRLPALPLLYSADQIQASQRVWRGTQLPEDAVLVGAPHNLLKFSPDFLRALAEILNETPQARLVLCESPLPAWNTAMQDQMAQVLGAAVAQVIWLSRLPAPDFLALLTQLDLLLDPFYFGAGKLAFEALGLGCPILTWPGQRLRGRIVAAAYRQMHYTPLICEIQADYVAKARHLLAHPRALQTHRQALIQRRQNLMRHPQALTGWLEALGTMGSLAAKA
ncbi:MAG: tetratricopeptide repeat protein [Candidatus Sericytochromatia bacterium]|nr:tetratricopeptide repeat protein [Candidatus Sericytochromatia bacterium]